MQNNELENTNTSVARGLLPSKLGLLSFTLVLPFIIVIGLMIIGQFDEIKRLETKQRHMLGVKYLETLYESIESLRDLSLVAAFGSDQISKTRYSQQQRSILQSISQFSNDSPLIEEVFFLKPGLDAVASKVAELTSNIGLETWAGAQEHHFSQHQKVVHSIRKLQVRLAEHAGMFTDQDQLASQLLFFSLEELDEPMQAMGQIRAYGSFVLFRGFLSSDSALLLDRAYEFLIASHEPLMHQLQAMKALPSGDGLGEIIASHRFDGVMKSAALLDTEIVQQEELSADWQGFYDALSTEIQSLYRVNANILGYQQFRYRERLSTYYQRQVYCIAGLVTLLVLFGFIYTLDRREAVDRQKEKREKQAAEATALARSKFLATMSHEIRTPINGILGMANLIQGTKLNDEQLRYLSAIQTSGSTLLGVINDILDYSKIEAGKLEVESITFDLPHMVDECVSLFLFTAQQKQLALVLHISPDVPCEVVSDPNRLRQVLLNMLSNAFKFTQNGRIDVTVSLELRDTEEYVRIAVKDTGIGIDKDRADTLFEAFEQADSSVTRKFGGTGLGLAISKQLVELLHGEIGASGEPGKGSEFWFDFEIRAEHHEPFTNWISRRIKREETVILVQEPAYRNELLDILGIWGFPCRVYDVQEEFADWISKRADQRVLVVSDVNHDHWMAQLPEAKKDMITKVHFGTDEEFEDFAGRVDYRVLSPMSIVQLRTILNKIFDDCEEVAKTAQEISEFDLKDMKILVAEDNAINQMVIKGTLKKLKAIPTVVENGQLAYDTYCANPKAFDLILMDWEMPVMDGITACISIRKWEKLHHNPSIAIVALTAHALEEYERRAYEAGMQGFLTKPINVQRLGAVLQGQLEKA